MSKIFSKNIKFFLPAIVLLAVYWASAVLADQPASPEQQHSSVPMVHKFGANADVDIAAAEDVRILGGDCYWAAAAVTTTIVAADANDTAGGSGARTVRAEGLGSDYRILQETVSLSGTNTVTFTNLFLRVYRASVSTAGSGGTNTDLLTISQDGNAVVGIGAGMGQSQTTCYTIPANYRSARMCYSFASMEKFTGAANAVADVHLLARPEGGAWQVKEEATVKSGRLSFTYDYSTAGCVPFAPKTDFRWRVNLVDSNNTSIVASYDMVLTP